MSVIIPSIYHSDSSIISEMDNHPITGLSSTVTRYKENNKLSPSTRCWPTSPAFILSIPSLQFRGSTEV